MPNQKAYQIFVCYRRRPSADAAGRLVDKLSSTFSAGRIFFDRSSIPPGVDFAEEIDEKIREIDVMLVIIDSEWIALTDDQGRQRLSSPTDNVRIEIEWAFKRGVKVIPVLVNNAVMPTASQLPDSLKSLARCLSKSYPRDIRFRCQGFVRKDQAIRLWNHCSGIQRFCRWRCASNSACLLSSNWFNALYRRLRWA